MKPTLLALLVSVYSALSYSTLTPAAVMDSVPPKRQDQVAHRNYMALPYSKWAFHHPTRVLPTAMIARGNAIQAFEDDITPALGELKVSGDKSFHQVFTEHHADGLVVLHNNKVVYEQYWNGMQRSDRHIWYSMTKSLTSTALGILVERGQIDLSKSPADYIPELANSGFARLTIQQVLDHQSGLNLKENYTDPKSVFLKHYGPAINMAFFPGAKDADPLNTEILGTHDFISKFVKADPSVQPGTVFDYNSTNADVIGWLISRVSGQDLADFIAQNIWQKLSTEHDAAIVVDRALMPVATGGMCSTTRDAARFGQMIMQKGMFNGEQIVSKNWVEQTTHIDPHYQDLMSANLKYQENQWQAYHNMWWILDAEQGEYAASGVYGQVIYINRAANTVISYFSSQPIASAAGNPDFIPKIRAARAMARYLRSL